MRRKKSSIVFLSPIPPISKDQTPDNYTYDAIGNLVADQQEHISSIKWNIYGKITDIEQSQANGSPGSTSSIQYQYDPSGNRISKIVSTQAAGATSPTTNTTWYARDAGLKLLVL